MIFNIKLKNRKILIAGGGRIAERKIKLFLAEDVVIYVISQEVSEFIQTLSDEGKIELTKRKIEPDDIKDKYFMVLCATNDQTVNNMISDICRTKNILHDNSGNHVNSDIMMTANVHINDITIAISTNGSSPEISKTLKNLLISDLDSSEYTFEDTIKAIYHKKI